MSDQYGMGFKAFGEGRTEDEIKREHPMFRAGWRAAQKRSQEESKTVTELTIEKVQRPVEGTNEYELKWPDVLAACRIGEWRCLERFQNGVYLVAIRALVEQRKDEIKSYGDIVRIIREYWNAILQHGYDEGVLSKELLLEVYKFTPKEAEEA